ncbi:MAG: alpha/beta hydrolase [Myxococcaceae bacterium]
MDRLHSAPAARVARGGTVPTDVALDAGKTAPFELPGERGACLLIHGFTGSPWDMRPLGEALSRAGIAAHGIRLPGHGTTPAAMLASHAPEWLLACDEALARLPGRRVAVAGLSMGALLGLVLAARHPGRVAGVAALAPAVRFRDRTLNSLRRFRIAAPLFELVRPWVLKDATDLLDAQARAEAPVLRAWPTARLRDLWEVQDLAWGSAARVTCPILVMVAAEDHVVDPAGAAALVRRLGKSPSVRHVRIDDSAHILPRDRNQDLVAAEVTAFVDRTLGPAAVR